MSQYLHSTSRIPCVSGFDFLNFENECCWTKCILGWNINQLMRHDPEFAREKNSDICQRIVNVDINKNKLCNE